VLDGVVVHQLQELVSVLREAVTQSSDFFVRAPAHLENGRQLIEPGKHRRCPAILVGLVRLFDLPERRGYFGDKLGRLGLLLDSHGADMLLVLPLALVDLLSVVDHTLIVKGVHRPLGVTRRQSPARPKTRETLQQGIGLSRTLIGGVLIDRSEVNFARHQ
jgi:hypothetical protein